MLLLGGKNRCLPSSFQLLAVELGLISTKMTKADKAEHIKRQRHSVSQTAASMQINTNPLMFS